MTSHDVVQRIRKVFGLQQVGHAGTLDPVASGVLVILVGSATRTAQYLQENDKEYHLTMRLGLETDTQDLTGNIISSTDPSGVTRDEFLSVMEKYKGSFMQVPPAFSAVKKNGQPLYKLARKGLPAEADPRKVNVYELELTGWTPPVAALEVKCSKGTYMRTLCNDIGRDLGVGGCLETLVRVRSGAFTISDSFQLRDVEENSDPASLLTEAATGLQFPVWSIEDADLERLLEGREVLLAGEMEPGLVSLVRNSRLIALGEVKTVEGKNILAPRRVFEPYFKELCKQQEKC